MLWNFSDTTLSYIYEEWFPNHPHYKIDPFGAVLEWYDQRFRGDSEYSEVDIYIPT